MWAKCFAVARDGSAPSVMQIQYVREWLPCIWSGEIPRFEDEAQAAAVTPVLLAFHDDVIRRLERDEWGADFRHRS